MITDMTRSVEVGQANLMQRLTGHSWQRIGVEMRGTVTPRQIPRYYKLRYYRKLSKNRAIAVPH